MFKLKENRYVTHRIEKEVPVEVQLLLWSIIDEAVSDGIELDYFQIFELRGEGNALTVVHRQEITAFERIRTYQVPIQLSIERSIWIIDSEGYQTMLLPEEY